MKILEREVEFDFLDIENLERYENALEEYMKELEEVKQFKGKDSEGFKKICGIVYHFFNQLLGEGSAVQLLGEKRNYGKCLKAMQEIVNEKIKSNKEINNMLGKYNLENESINP